MRCLRRIFEIRLQNKISNNDVLEKADITTMFSMLSLRRLKWLGHTKKMEDVRLRGAYYYHYYLFYTYIHTYIYIYIYIYIYTMIYWYKKLLILSF
jgi:hypothetical protein